MRIPKWLKDTRNRGILAAIGVLLVIVLYSTTHPAANTSTPLSNLTISPSNISLLAGTEAATTGTTSAITSPSTSVSTTPKTKAVSINPAVSTPAPVSNIPAKELTASGGRLLASLVNIVCVSGDSSIPSISGSGVIIDSRGIILTAAHVAQFFLLQDYLGPDKVECLIRTGSPARRAYLGEPIYVSPTWVANNPTTLTKVSPEGTGENDFALVGITDTATSTPLPNSFPYTPLAQDDPQQGEQVAIGSYGAQYLSASQLNTSLYPILVFGSIQTRYTFHSNTVDIISIIGSAASQEGSSGGGIADAAGELQGMITTSSIAGDLSTRSLNAITIGHMRRSFNADTGANLDEVLRDNSLSTLIAGFAAESKLLGQELVNATGVN